MWMVRGSWAEFTIILFLIFLFLDIYCLNVIGDIRTFVKWGEKKKYFSFQTLEVFLNPKCLSC